MRLWMAAPLAFAATAGLLTLDAQRAAAQPAKGGVAESFMTADGVELNGLFHATAKDPNSAPVVVFMYAPGADRDMTKGDWGGLAQRLNAEGYHVFQFDWRGHGKSTSIKDTTKFWTNLYLNRPGPNYNGYIRGGPGRPLKNDLMIKDLGPRADRYMPVYLNDLAAVRLHLDLKNDNNQVNTSTIYIVGTEETAGLGMAWLTAEWTRPAVFPTVGQLGPNPTYAYVPQQLNGDFPTEAGSDFGGAVWLTAKRPITFAPRTIQRWVTNPATPQKLRENNPMLFLYGDKDALGKRQSEFFYNEVLVAAPRKGTAVQPLGQTFIKEVKGAEKLEGVKLLGQNATLKTEDTIVLYFAAIQKVRAKIPSKARKFTDPYYIDVRYYGLTP